MDNQSFKTEYPDNDNCDELWSDQSTSLMVNHYVAFMKSKQYPCEHIFEQIAAEMKGTHTADQCKQRILGMVEREQQHFRDHNIKLPENLPILSQNKLYDIVYIERSSDNNDILTMWSTMLELDKKSEESAERRRSQRIHTQAQQNKKLLESVIV